MNKSRLSLSRRVAQGFTLIELMIVVAIIGILAGVAYPAYTDYVRRGNLTEAFQVLSSAQIKMEQYYQDNRAFGSGSTCGYVPTNSDYKYFDFSCAKGADWNSYTVTATGRSSTAAKNHVYTINQAGTKATTQLKGATVSLTCWATKSASDCS